MWLGLLCKPKVKMFFGWSVCIERLRGLVWVEALGYGNWEKSYNELRQWLSAIKQYLLETVIILEPKPYKFNGQVLEMHKTFHCLFWAFHPCIDGFNFCKPIVQVDGTWLYGKYKGTLLLAVAQDGKNHIFSIAFALVEGETKDAWSFFLKNLRRHVTPQRDICLILDRHESIKSAYNDPQNGWHDTPTTHVHIILCGRSEMVSFGSKLSIWVITTLLLSWIPQHFYNLSNYYF